MVYSVEERVEMIKLFFRNNDSARVTADLFNERHPGNNVSAAYVVQLVAKFDATGSVGNKKRVYERDEAREVAVLGHVAMDPTLSTRKLSDVSGVSRTTIMRILKQHKFHPFKIRLVQELNEDDFDRRLQFCEVVSEMINDNQNYMFDICFSDECSFYLNGIVNRHNCRYWSDENPRLFREVHTQHPQKLNVWAGIYGNHIIGPFFIPGNLTGQIYLDLLENAIYPALVQVLENEEDHQTIIFQQDGAPPHFVQPVRQFLDENFPDAWIGRRGHIEWPPRSPDLAPLDFFLWGHLKSKIYATQPESLDDLRNRIINECRQITPQMLNNVRERFQQNLFYCMEVNGAHFQHLIN